MTSRCLFWRINNVIHLTESSLVLAGSEYDTHWSRGLLVSLQNSWYLRGVLSIWSVESIGSLAEERLIALHTDIADPGVLAWLTGTMDKLNQPRVSMEVANVSL